MSKDENADQSANPNTSSNLPGAQDAQMSASNADHLGEQATLWYQKPEQIDLRDYIVNPPSLKNHDQKKGLPNVLLPMTYNLHFIAINGEQPAIS